MSTLLILGGTGLQAASQIQQGRIAESQGKFAKEIGARNKAALDRQATAELEAAKVEESRVARKEKLVKGAQRALSAKSGGGLAGASLNVLTDTAFQFSLERNLILRQGLIRSRELIERGGIELAKGRFASSVGKSQKQASILGAFGSGLSGVGLLSGNSLSPKTKTSFSFNQPY